MLSTLPKELPSAPDSVILSCSRCASQLWVVIGAVRDSSGMTRVDYCPLPHMHARCAGACVNSKA